MRHAITTTVPPDTTLGEFTEEESDNEDGLRLSLFTAGSGDGTWAFVVEDSESTTLQQKRAEYTNDTKSGFVPQLLAVANGMEYLNNDYPDALVEILTPQEAIVDLVEGKTDPDDNYRDHYRTANRIYNDHRTQWSLKHIGGGQNNPAKELL